MVNYRHGDIALVGIDKLPEGLKVSMSKTIHSKTQSHCFDTGKFYPKKEAIVIGYFVADNTTLLHPEHGKGKKGQKMAKIKNGIYEVRVQQEIMHNEMKAVID